MSDFDTMELRRAFGSFISGVTVVTAFDKQANPVGFTANSFSSVSMDPPLLLVCPGNHLSSFETFNSADHFAVNILAADQKDVSALFATSHEDRFSQTGWREDSVGNPILDGTIAHFSCRTFKRVEAGDHIVLIGEVLSFDANGEAGLGYAQGGYFTP